MQYVLLDDQSKPDVARTLYERLITSDKVDLILGPYGTAAILAGMTVAQRYKKLYIENTMGTPQLATYEWHFAATVGGAEPNKTAPNIVLDAYSSTGHPPKSIFIAVTKFPSALFQAEGTRDAATARGIKVLEYLQYEFGTRDFGPIAARVKDADPDLMWLGCLGVDGNLLLEALGKLDYKPKRHFYLYPSSGPLATLPAAENAISSTNFEDVKPYIDDPVGGEFARLFDARAAKAGLPYPHADSQGALEYAGWQILTAAVNATKSFDGRKARQLARQERGRYHRRPARLQGEMAPEFEGPHRAAADPGRTMGGGVADLDRHARLQADRVLNAETSGTKVTACRL